MKSVFFQSQDFLAVDLSDLALSDDPSAALASAENGSNLEG